VLPATAQAKTGAEDAAQQSADIKDGFGFLTTILLVFAGISVFVGGFLIFNTFSITVAQRTREFGMLRTLGASSRQVLSSVAVEALLLGLIASIVGILAGLGFVKLIVALFKVFGLELPQSGVVVPTAAIVAGLLVGLISTLLSSIVPAIRATRVTPLEALRDTPLGGDHVSRRRAWIARVLVLLAALAIVAGLFATNSFGSAISLLGLGLILLFIGVAMLAGAIVKPIASAVGRPIEALRGVTGRLARENTLRNPSRTATTSAALMIGVALVVFAAVFAASAKKSLGDALERTFVSDLVVTSQDGFSPFSPKVAEDLRKIDGVGVVSPVGGAPAEAELPAGDKQQILTGLDPTTLPDVADLDWTDGDDETLRDLGPDEAIVESKWAEDNGVSVGDRITLRKVDGSEFEVHVVGSVRDQVQLLVQSVALPIATLRSEFDANQDFVDLVDFSAGADAGSTRADVESFLEGRFPQVEARSQTELKDVYDSQLNTILGLIYALLALSVIISLFGVVNTLVLTIYERTREIGMLRAIGSSRSQIKRMVRYESLITAMIGAVIGAAIGLVISVAAVQALADDGLSLGIPVIGIVLVLIVAGIAGIVAGVWPARRASKIEVMEALQYE
jgi:putative ABC transport system permease protein